MSSYAGLIIFGAIALLVILLLATSIKIVRQSEVHIVERLGKFHRTMESGIHVIVPFIDRIVAKKSLKEHVIDFPPQPVITKDNVSANIDFVVYYQITDPVKNEYEIENAITAIENLTSTTLRNLIGEQELDDTYTSRDYVNTRLRTVLDEASDRWGIKVNRVEIRNIDPPKDIQDAMERQMRAERLRREKVLEARGLKESEVLRAEGEKQAAILKAEADKAAEITRAEGEKESQILQAEGEAEAIRKVSQARAEGQRIIYEAIKKAAPTKEVVQLRSMEALEKVSMGQATKIVIPSDATSLLGTIAGAKEVLSDKNSSQQNHQSDHDEPVLQFEADEDETQR
ncbi:MAG: SPFH/Band 7/PHB domain protein [Bacillaceae bacterium]|nr:SPFH/Band 7/PHB domain protein [Bacillaceae bacterium]